MLGIFGSITSAGLVLCCCGSPKLRDVDNLEKFDEDRAVVIASFGACLRPFLSFFSASLPPTKTRRNGLKSLPEIKKDTNYK